MADSSIPLVEDRPVVAFFLGAYLYTWVVSAPAVFMEPSWSAAILVYAGSFGPPISAAVVTWLRGDDIRAWARQITRWRVGWKWWAVAAGLPIVAAVGITLVLVVVRGPVDLGQAFPSPVLFAAIFLFALLLSGGLNEEPGWRGFAQPHLNERYGAVPASLLIGVVWAGWHAPYFVIPVTPHSSFPLVNTLGWIGGILTLSILLGWLYNNTGSVLLAMVLHAMANTADVVIPLAADQIVIDGIIDESAVGVVTVVHLAVYVFIVFAVIAVYGRERLTDGEMPDATDAGARP
ncbi:CPBP family intramembrane glutamic endopeptidase [Natronomonas gomsonensis]|uniref:CPBP family intramembrane glutamic endopeptidase n=1 Tax=Natronomonas gomsonensis TaxID=1046043 RepID=UPI001C4C69A5|nr:type II CAAX endopeptidase family protein [Natronomonas gomsonensis]